MKCISSHVSCALVAAEVYIQTRVVRTKQHIYVFMSLYSLILKTHMQKYILFSAYIHRNMYKIRPQSKIGRSIVLYSKI